MADTSWIGSINIDSFTKQLMARASAQIDDSFKSKLDSLAAQQGSLNTQISAYGNLQNLMNTFQQSLQAMTTSFNPTYQASSSSPSVAIVQSTGTSIAQGTHSLSVTTLAQAESVASGTFASGPLGVTDSLSFTIGAANFSVNVASTDALQDVCNNINASPNNIGVTASIVSTASGQYQLIVSSNQTGVANKVEISETGTGSNALNISNITGGTGTELTAAQDAIFTFDNLAFDTPTNMPTVEGMNLSLLSVGTTNISVNSSNQATAASTAIQAVVTAYNNIQTFISQTLATSGSPDPTLSNMQATLQNTMSSALSSGAYPSLQSIGITPSQDVQGIPVTYKNGDAGFCYPVGLLTVDTSVTDSNSLPSALNNNFAAVQSLMTNALNGIGTQLTGLLNSGTGSLWKSLNQPTTGSVAIANSQLATVKSEITDDQALIKDLKKGLLAKYAKLDMMLASMQTTSQYLTQQIQVMDKSS